MATLHNIVSDNIYTVLLPIEPKLNQDHHYQTIINFQISVQTKDGHLPLKLKNYFMTLDLY